MTDGYFGSLFCSSAALVLSLPGKVGIQVGIHMLMSYKAFFAGSAK
jgi:hypothetical protein